MTTRSSDGYLLCDRFSEYGVLAATTTRTRLNNNFNMSFSHAESAAAYEAALALWLKDFGLQEKYENQRILFLHLVHGIHVIKVTEVVIDLNAPGTFLQQCDGLITDLSGKASVVLTVKTADCIPVFLFDCSTRASGLVHCGWRGLRDNILYKAIRTMYEAYGCDGSTLLMHMGPYICPDHFEVGLDVAVHFQGASKRRGAVRCLDLGQIAEDQARAAGVLNRNISRAGICTWERNDFFSYRRDGPGGAMLSFITVL